MAKKSAAAQALEAAEARRDEAEKAGEASPIYDFFKVQRKYNKDTDSWHFAGVKIVQSKFIELLKRLGFRRYTVGEKFIIVRIQDNVIEEVSIPDLRLTVKYYFDDLPDDLEEVTQCPKDELVEKLTCCLGTLLGEDKLSLLVDRNETSFPIIQDTRTTAYHFYENGWVGVTADGVKFHSYDVLPGLVWKDQILPRRFTPLQSEEWEKSPFNDFLNNVANGLNEENERSDPARRLALNTLAGYMMHRYFEGDLKIVNLLDSRMNDEYNPEGRSGKSLFFKAIRRILNPIDKESTNCLFFDGKEFDPTNRFKWDKLARNTVLVVLNDVRRNFPIDLLFNAVHDGVEQEKKNGERRNVVCKVGLTMNYSLRLPGDSSKDRVVEFEVSSFYHRRNKPYDVHGHWFFSDWDAEQWNQFDNLMMDCIRCFLRTGIVLAEGINLFARKLQYETCSEFVTYMEEMKIEHEQSFDKKQLYEKFKSAYPEVDFKTFKQRMFTTWLRLWAEYRPEMAGYRESRSSGNDYIRFFHNTTTNPEFLAVSGENIKVKLFEGKSDNCTFL